MKTWAFLCADSPSNNSNTTHWYVFTYSYIDWNSDEPNYKLRALRPIMCIDLSTFHMNVLFVGAWQHIGTSFNLDIFVLVQVYSLGIAFWQLFHNANDPFPLVHDHKALIAVLRAHHESAPLEFFRTTPTDIQHLITRMCSINPARRPTAIEVCKELVMKTSESLQRKVDELLQWHEWLLEDTCEEDISSKARDYMNNHDTVSSRWTLITSTKTSFILFTNEHRNICVEQR